jgi:hypothetical protein
MKNNPHIQTLLVMVICAAWVASMVLMPVVSIFIMLFFIVYATIYSDIIKQQDEHDKR